MKCVRIDAVYNGKVELNLAAITILREKKPKAVALYSSVQFCSKLDHIFAQLKDLNIAFISSKPSRTDVTYQILGCDAYFENLRLKEMPDLFLYIGDGMFHPRALLLAQKDLSKSDQRPVLIMNPPENSARLLTFEHITPILKKYRIALKNFLKAEKVGLLITLKPGQQHLKAAITLEKTYPEKKFFHFIDDTIDYNNFNNFPFIKVWVNTACPRIGFDDAAEFRQQSMINIADAMKAVELLQKESVLNE